jgi:hypothetical protein
VAAAGVAAGCGTHISQQHGSLSSSSSSRTKHQQPWQQPALMLTATLLLAYTVAAVAAATASTHRSTDAVLTAAGDVAGISRSGAVGMTVAEISAGSLTLPVALSLCRRRLSRMYLLDTLRCLLPSLLPLALPPSLLSSLHLFRIYPLATRHCLLTSPLLHALPPSPLVLPPSSCRASTRWPSSMWWATSSPTSAWAQWRCPSRTPSR